MEEKFPAVFVNNIFSNVVLNFGSVVKFDVNFRITKTRIFFLVSFIRLVNV